MGRTFAWRFGGRSVAMVSLVAVVACSVDASHRTRLPATHRRGDTRPRAQLANDQSAEGLYVRGLRLSGGVSFDKVRAKFGPDDERYGKPGRVSYEWRLRDKTRLTATFDAINSLQSATLAITDRTNVSPTTYAVLSGSRIVPGRVTLSGVRRGFPEGQLGELLSGENLNILGYAVRFGGEGSEMMRFSVSWLGNPEDKTVAQRNRLPVTSIEVGFFKDLLF